MFDRKLDSTTYPFYFFMASSADHVTGVTGLSPTVLLTKSGANPAAAAGAVAEVNVPAPAAPTTSGASSTGGFLAQSTTYYYKITATNALGETTPSAETSYAVPASGTSTNQITLNWAAVQGATGYKVYRGTASGGELLLATLGAVTSYADATNATPAGAPPGANTTGFGWYQLAGDATDRNTLGTCLVHATAGGCDPCDGRMNVVPWDPYDGNLALTGLAGLAAIGQAGGLPTIGTGAGQLSPDGTGALPVAFGTALPASPAAGSVGEALKFADTRLDAAVSSRSIYAGGAVASVTAPVTVAAINGQAPPANWASMVITAGGAVTVGTNQDKSGYSLTQAFPANFANLAVNGSGQVTIQPGSLLTLDSGTVSTASSSSQFTAAGANLHATASGWYNGRTIVWQSPAANLGANRPIATHTYANGQHVFLMQQPFPVVPAANDFFEIA